MGVLLCDDEVNSLGLRGSFFNGVLDSLGLWISACDVLHDLGLWMSASDDSFDTF